MRAPVSLPFPSEAIMRALVVLFLLASPLSAEPLLEHFWGSSFDESAIAGEAGSSLLAWLKELTACNKRPHTHFEVDGKAAPFEISGVKGGELLARRLQRQGTAPDGKAQYRAVGEEQQFTLAQWPLRYLLTTWGPANHEPKKVAGLAVWLYSRQAKDDLYANRALTELHERAPELRPLIEAFVMRRERASALVIAEVWDAEFRVSRKVLISEADRDDHAKARRSAAREELLRIRTQILEPAKRSETLEQLLSGCEQWKRHFADVADQVREERELPRLMKRVSDEIKARDIHAEAARKSATAAAETADSQKTVKLNHWEEAAQEWERAHKLDPANMQLLSEAANSWLKAADAEFDNRAGQYSCTREPNAKRAEPLYRKLVAAYPAAVPARMSFGLCLQLTGRSEAAIDEYRAVIQTAPGTAEEAEAKRRIDQIGRRR